MKCSICNKDILGDIVTDSEGLQKVVFSKGHNAQPINDGRCCDRCNNTKVIPARIMNAYNYDKNTKDKNFNNKAK